MRGIKSWVFMTGTCLLLSACSRPVANFRISKSGQSVPSEVTFTDESEGADSLVWELNQKIVSSDSIYSDRLLLSGRYHIKLTALKGKKTSVMEQDFTLLPPDECLVELKTRFGSMIIKLFDETPKHRDNFIKLVEAGYYDGLIFHRVIDDFMIQGGDPESRNADPQKRLGSGGPGYQIEAEFSKDLVHVKGALAAARTGDAVNPEKKSSGSQFYIVKGTEIPESQLDQIGRRLGIQYSEEVRETYKKTGGTPFLDYQYTVFGIVVEGLDIIDKIADVNTNAQDRPIEDITFEISLIK